LSGKIRESLSYHQYDADGNKIWEEEFNPSGKLTGFSGFVIRNGVGVEKTIYDSNNKIKSNKYYIYTT